MEELFKNLFPKTSGEIAWDDFEKFIKTHRRFFFENEANILKKIKDIIIELGLIDVIPKDTIIYRARSFKEGNKIINNLRWMGPPLPEDIKHISNRMSPPGIPIFYGSLDKTTALSEISYIKRNRYANIATFKLLKDIEIIDFGTKDTMKVPKFSNPSQIDKEKWHNILFMRAIGQKFSESIEKDGREHTDYLPTQVFTEYIRHKMKNIKGIKYDSSKTRGANLALFLNQKEHFCDDESNIKNNHYLYFIADKNNEQAIEIPVARSYKLSLVGFPYCGNDGVVKIQKRLDSFEFYFAFFDQQTSEQTNGIVDCPNKFSVNNKIYSYVKVEWNIPTYKQNILDKFRLDNQDTIEKTMSDKHLSDYAKYVSNTANIIKELSIKGPYFKKLILHGQYYVESSEHVESNTLKIDDNIPNPYTVDNKSWKPVIEFTELEPNKIDEYAKLKQEFSKLNLY